MPTDDRRRRDGDEQVYSITSASTAHSDELSSREIRYAISMGIRSVCFVAGVIVWQYQVWIGVVLIVLATFLPYTSVVMANAGVRKKGSGSDIMTPGPYGEIDAPEEKREL